MSSFPVWTLCGDLVYRLAYLPGRQIGIYIYIKQFWRTLVCALYNTFSSTQKNERYTRCWEGEIVPYGPIAAAVPSLHETLQPPSAAETRTGSTVPIVVSQARSASSGCVRTSVYQTRLSFSTKSCRSPSLHPTASRPRTEVSFFSLPGCSSIPPRAHRSVDTEFPCLNTYQ